MSGEGVALFADELRTTMTGAVTTAIVDAIIAEREGVLTYARAQCGVIDGLVERGKLPGVDAAELKLRLRAFADGIAIGLHRDGLEDSRVRAALRQVVAPAPVPSGDDRTDMAAHIAAGNGDD